ncbi:MAG: glycoside hydrolase family 5 protein [Treponema sp.]|nr:glycoside hydrolase family 5 protein [Treponema sp.]
MKKLIFSCLLIISAALLLSCKPKITTQPVIPEPTPAAPVTDDSVFTKEFLFDDSIAIKDTGSVTFGNITGTELTAEMQVGWNLGNTFDATGTTGMDSETSWGQPRTTRAMIDGLAASGIKTIRIPVSWHNHITDKKTYTISPEWMSRVKQVVDWAIEDGLYVIINAHHDNYEKSTKMLRGSGYYPNSTNLVESQRYLYNIWGQIATAFNNGYDEHLVFETMNEPRLAGTSCEWWYDGDSKCQDAAKCLNEMNQTALDAIRSTGGNNTKRFVMCPSLAASENSATKTTFKMPQDIEGQTGRLILSVHAYTPYSFAMESPGETSFTMAHREELDNLFSKLKARFIDKGYPVIIGEYGATNKNNLQDRIAWFEYYVSKAKSNGIPCILWDNGVYQTRTTENGEPDYSEGYGYYDRINQQWYFPGILQAMLDASE